MQQINKTKRTIKNIKDMVKTYFIIKSVDCRMEFKTYFDNEITENEAQKKFDFFCSYHRFDPEMFFWEIRKGQDKKPTKRNK